MTIYVTFKGHKIEDGKPKEGGQTVNGISAPLSAAEVVAVCTRLKAELGLADVYLTGWEPLKEEQADGA